MAQTYIQRYDGEWSDVTTGVNVACCDCGLVHHLEFAVLEERILKRVFRDRRATANRRRRKEVKSSIKTLNRKVNK